MKHFLRKTFLLLGAICLSSCASVTPNTNERGTVSYDGNDQTAGVLGFNEDGSLTITKSGRDRYNALVEKFGGDTTPKTSKDFGIKALEDGNYSLTLEGAERWHLMNLMLDRSRVNKADSIFNP